MNSESLEKKPLQYTLIIPAWNESAFIVESIHAAQKAMQTQNYRGKIVVVDNNSTDDTASKALEAGADVVFEPVNQISRARNAGARSTSTPWLIFVDADSLITSQLLTLILNALASEEIIGGGSTVAIDRKDSKLAASVVKFWNWLSVKTRTAAGCLVYCKRDAFVEIGGFSDKAYAGEELVLSRQLRKLAKKRDQHFVIQTAAPIMTSTRKLDWYSPVQIAVQCVLLIIPGTVNSKRLCGLWYNRNNIK